MHELSIAQDIVEMIYRYVPAAERNRVRAVRTIVGEQSGVEKDSLLFSYEAITAATDLMHSKLVIEHIPFTIHCKRCGVESRTTMGTKTCPKCGETDSNIVGGTELHVRELELADILTEPL